MWIELVLEMRGLFIEKLDLMKERNIQLGLGICLFLLLFSKYEIKIKLLSVDIALVRR